MFTHIIVLAFVMISAGMLGGFINYQLMQNQNAGKANLSQALIVGVGAALLVPMFLELISSNLILSSRENPAELLTFLGFCLLAAIASRLIMTNLSQQTLQEAQLASRRAQALEQELQQIQSGISPLLLTKTEDAIEEIEDDETPTELLDVISLEVLGALDNAQHIFRSLQGICTDAGQEATTAEKFLSSLMLRGFVGKTNSPKGMRWYITEKGRKVLKSPQIDLA